VSFGGPQARRLDFLDVLAPLIALRHGLTAASCVLPRMAVSRLLKSCAIRRRAAPRFHLLNWPQLILELAVAP